MRWYLKLTAALALLMLVGLSGCVQRVRTPYSTDPDAYGDLSLQYENHYPESVVLVQKWDEPDYAAFEGGYSVTHTWQPHESGGGTIWGCGKDKEIERYSTSVKVEATGQHLDARHWDHLPCDTWIVRVTETGEVEIVPNKDARTYEYTPLFYGLVSGGLLVALGLLVAGIIWVRRRRAK